MKKKITGKEARYILRKNRINQADLAAKLGITPQSLNSRLNVEEFTYSRQLEINNVLQQNIFDLDQPMTDRQPIIDARISAGTGCSLEDDDNNVIGYVQIPSFHGCIGVIVYGDSMEPAYMSGDVVFVRPVNVESIDYGRPYIIITNDERYLKNVYKSEHDADNIRCVSNNDDTNRYGDRRYPDFDIPKTNIIHLYKVVGILRREN